VLVLAGDIGGTHTRLTLAETEGATVRLLHTGRYLNARAQGLEEHLSDFLAHLPRPGSACFAVAGPTDGRHVRLTNLPWAIDAGSIESAFHVPRARLINDFQAVGYGIAALDDAHLAVLQPGHPEPQAARAVLGAGTGLGVTFCIHEAGGYRPLPSEGGHIGFAPADPEQDALLRFLREKYRRASVERILSGSGIVDLYRFGLHQTGQPGEEHPLLGGPLPAAAVTGAALDASDPTAVRAMALFCRIYGQTAGDLALLAQATGGVYLAGGIAPKILALLMQRHFLEGFLAKGRFSDWMRRVPVKVVLDEDVGLKGAALAAQAA